MRKVTQILGTEQIRLQLIVYACEEYEVFAERFEQVFHRDHRRAGGNKIVEHDYVILFRWFCSESEHRPDTVLRVALGNIFVERYAEKLREPGRNERRKISDLVATLGRGNDAPVARGERVAEDLPDKGIHALGKFLHHIGVALNVGQRPAIERLFPERDDSESGITVGNSHLVRGEVAASLGLLHIFPCCPLFLGEKVFALSRGNKRSVEVRNIKRRHFDVFQHLVQRYCSLPDASVRFHVHAALPEQSMLLTHNSGCTSAELK